MLPYLSADVVEDSPAAELGVVSQLGEPPTSKSIRQKWTAYMQGEAVPQNQQVDVLEIWDQANGSDQGEKLSKMVASIAILRPELVAMAGDARRSDAESAEAEAWREQVEMSPFLRDPLQLWIALGWIRHQFVVVCGLQNAL